MTDSILRAASAFGVFVGSGLMEYAESCDALMRRAVQEDARALEDRIITILADAASGHQEKINARIRTAIQPLIVCRACRAAIIAQARHSNNRQGRINALPDSMVVDLVDDILTKAAAQLKVARRA